MNSVTGKQWPTVDDYVEYWCKIGQPTEGEAYEILNDEFSDAFGVDIEDAESEFSESA